jgi:predicted phage tail protein
MFLGLQRSLDMQQTVRLLGELGERHGSVHVYGDLRSPAEAIRLLCINRPEFQKELCEAHHHGVGYTLVQAGEALGYEDLNLPLGKNDLILTPVVAGSGGRGTTSILAGVGLVALAIVAAPLGAGFLGLGAGAFTATTGTALVTGAATGFATTAALGTLSVALGSIGASLVLSGTAQLLSPQPEPLTGLGNRFAGGRGENTSASGPQGISRATSGTQSYAFQGPANTVGVGATVPLAYGEVLIGSHLLASRVDVSDESDPTSESIVSPGTDTITVNGERPTNVFQALGGLRTRTWGNLGTVLSSPVAEGGVRTTGPDLELDDTTSKRAQVDFPHRNTPRQRKRRDNFQVFLELDRGLFTRVGRTRVPGFVTYEIVLQGRVDGPDPDVARVQGTIQGLLNPSDNYRWCHAIQFTDLANAEGDSTLRMYIRIIDKDCVGRPDNVNKARIRVRSIGFEHFQGSQDDTGNLANV